MEIVLAQFNIDEAIESHWQAVQTKSEIINRDRQDAENAAVNALVQQFKRELDTFLESKIQAALNFKIVPPVEIAVLSVFAVFSFLSYEIILRRDSQSWEIAFNGKTVTCSPDLLQKTLLMELGKIKNTINI